MAERLTRARWVEEGLAVLREDGAEALGAEKLAKRLGVSRGSFYWHFKSAASFEAAILSAWEERWTSRLIETVGASSDGPSERLRLLISATGGLDADIYGAAKRMARKRPEHPEAMHRIDDRRIQFVAAILVSGGVPDRAALSRARIIYAWAMGHMLTGVAGKAIEAEVVETLVDFAFAD